MVGCAAVFPAASSVGVARSPHVGVPSIPCVVSGGWWVCAGVIRTASDLCFGGACWGFAPLGVVQRPLGVGRRSSLRRGMPFLGVGPGACRGVLFLCASVPALAPCWFFGGFLPPRCVASGALSLWALVPHFGPLRAPLPECPFLSLALPLPVPFPFPGVVVVGWVKGADGPGLGVGGLEPLAEGLGGVGGGRRPWTASRRRASHAACSMMASGAASLESAEVGVRTSSKVCTMCTPSRLPAPPAHFTQWRSSCKAGADHQARWAGAWGGEGSELKVLERRGEDVGLRLWRGWRRLGERERRLRGLGVEDGYGPRREREGEGEMGRRWRAWRRLGEQEWWWRGLGVEEGYGRRGERGGRWGPGGEGKVDVGRRGRAWRCRGERDQWWRGLGVRVAYGRRGEREARWGPWGEGEVDMGRQWRAWWRPGERERQKRGPGGSWWRLGER